jgi:hypothetical protein
MSKKIGGVIALVGICALSVFLLNCGSSSSRPSGVLYVLTQGSLGFGNNISSFAIDLGSGNLSLVNSNAGTCPTAANTANPAPCGQPLDILLDPTGATAFVLNQGIPSATPADAIAPTIYPYTVNSDGSLSAPGTPAAGWNCIYPDGSSCGVTPPYALYYDTPLAMVLDAAGQFLFVIDQGQLPPKTTCPPVGIAANSLMDANNFAGCPSISVFAVNKTTLTFVSQSSTYQSPFFIGRIPTALSALTFPTPGSGTTPACGFTTSEEFLYVTSNQDLSQQHNDNALSVYCVSSTGNLTDMTPAPPAPPYTPAVNPLSVQAVNTNPAGQNTGGVFVYVGSQPSASGALSVFRMCTVVGNTGCMQQDVTNALLLPVLTPPPPATGQNPVAMLVDPTNNFLYVVCYGSSQVAEYRINTANGSLSTPAYQPTGSQPVSMALHASVNSIGQSLYNNQSGQFLFVSNSNSDNITGFTLSTTSGAMSNPITVMSPAAPSGMAVH